DVGLRAWRPDAVIGFVGGHVSARREESLRFSGVIAYVARKEFDLAVVAVAEGRPLAEGQGISFLSDGRYVQNAEPAPLDSAQLDALPFATDVYARDLDYRKDNSPYCHYPYLSPYTRPRCPARCPFPP